MVDLEASQEVEGTIVEYNQEPLAMEIIVTKKPLEDVTDPTNTMVVMNVTHDQFPKDKSATTSAPQWLETSFNNKKRNVVPASLPIEDMVRKCLGRSPRN